MWDLGNILADFEVGWKGYVTRIGKWGVSYGKMVWLLCKKALKGLFVRFVAV